MAVHRVDELTGHLPAHPPVVEPSDLVLLVGDVVAVVEDDRDARELLELLKRDRHALEWPGRALQSGRDLPFGEDEAAARFQPDDGAHVAIADRGEPRETAGVKVHDHDARPDAVERCRDAADDDLGVDGSCVRNHAAEELLGPSASSGNCTPGNMPSL